LDTICKGALRDHPTYQGRTWPERGFANPVSLDAAVNSEAHEGGPFVAPDGRWKSARRLKTPAGAVCPYVSPDERFFFFLKFDGGAFGLYWMDASGLGLKGDSRTS
jgi:hypothetical protein